MRAAGYPDARREKEQVGELDRGEEVHPPAAVWLCIWRAGAARRLLDEHNRGLTAPARPEGRRQRPSPAVVVAA